MNCKGIYQLLKKIYQLLRQVSGVKQDFRKNTRGFIRSVKILGDLSADETDFVDLSLSAPWKAVANLSVPDKYFWDFFGSS